MKFDRQIFFDRVRPIIEIPGGIGVLQSQIDGLRLLLEFMEGDARLGALDPQTAIRVMAYFLSTVAHETTIGKKIGAKRIYFKSFEPVEEMGGEGYLNRMYDTRVDLGNTPQRDGDGAKYAGDGYVQDTGKANARKSGRRLAGTAIRHSAW
jgi:putative chitinase